MIRLITFTDDRMTISAEKLAYSALRMGCDRANIFRPDDLPEWFVAMQSNVLQHEKGYGYYCWKPWIVADTIHKMEGGDILVYADAGNEFISSVQPIIDQMALSDEEIFLFSNGWPHVDWCKGDTLNYILNWNYGPGHYGNEADQQYHWFRERKQVQASTMFFRVSQQSKDFCKEWLALSLVPGLIDNEPSKLANAPTFAEHRWDQSILGCLQIKNGIPLHWFPTTTAQYLRKDYPADGYLTLLNHHRKRNHEWT